MKTREEALEYFKHQGGYYVLDDDPDTGGFWFKYEVREPAADGDPYELVLTLDYPHDDGPYAENGESHEYRYGLQA